MPRALTTTLPPRIYPRPTTAISDIPTLEDFYDRQVLHLSRSVVEHTSAAYRIAWEYRLNPTLGHLPLDQIDFEVIEDAYEVWTGKPSTKNDAIALLSRLLKRAIRAKIIDHNPVNDCEFPPQISVDLSARALSEPQFKDLLSRIERPVYQWPVIFLKETGLRFGEMSALMENSIDLDRGIVHVSRTYVQDEHGKTKLESRTKGRNHRIVPIGTTAMTALESALTNSRRLGVQDRVFSGPQGGILNGKNLSRAVGFYRWRDTIKRYPRNEPALKWHDLRHTACVRYFDDGLTAPEVQKIMGHASLSMTEHYARASNYGLLAAREKIVARRG